MEFHVILSNSIFIELHSCSFITYTYYKLKILVAAANLKFEMWELEWNKQLIVKSSENT